MQPIKQQYERPVEIADRVFWVGFHDATSNLHCNPYLVVEGGSSGVDRCGKPSRFLPSS